MWHKECELQSPKKASTSLGDLSPEIYSTVNITVIIIITICARMNWKHWAGYLFKINGFIGRIEEDTDDVGIGGWINNMKETKKGKRKKIKKIQRWRNEFHWSHSVKVGP